jgi:hypothetical protein
MSAVRRRAAILAFGLLLTLPALAAIPGPECEAIEATTDFGRRSPESVELSKDLPRVDPAGDESTSAAAWYKAQLVLTQDAPRPWRLTVRDADNHLLANFSDEDFRIGNGSQWTGILPRGSEIVLEIDEASPVVVRIATVIVYPRASDAHYFSTQQDQPNWTGLYREEPPKTGKVDAPVAQRVGASVGMIVGGQPNALGGYTEWCCTGVMVSKDVMMTNWHCGKSATKAAWNANVCPNMVVDLARDDRAGVRQQYACAEVLEGDPNLDYALIRLKPVAGGSAYTGAPAYQSLATAAPVSPGAVFSVHHAQCKAKLLSRGCSAELKSVANQAGTNEFAHTCDTEAGSSGAPIFNNSGRLVGMHHRGFLRNGVCEVVGPKRNYAIPIVDIVANLRSRNADLAKQLRIGA